MDILPERKGVAMTASDTDRRTLRRQVVVLVDDDPEVLSALRRLFRDESFDVLATEDPQEALEWIRTRDVDVVLADDSMPVMSGTSLLQLAKSHSPGTARIMLTGHSGEDIIAHCHTEGLFRVFAKPWDDRELQRAIRDRLRERESEGSIPGEPC
jgi:DNA-binding NtrC family response regulator